jgi:predicted Holliday junction resolvase-like endonuclease
MDKVVETANYVSQQSDRWMFVALLIIGIMCIWVLFKYFTSRLDRLQGRMDTQTNEFLAHLKTANKEMLDVIAMANATIAKNSMLLERIDKKLNP